jgi:putative phosphoesterase
MKIAVVSDTHGRAATVGTALGLIAAHQIELIIHCGDIDDAETVALFPRHTHFVFGNCDIDRAGIRAALGDLGANLHEPFGTLEVADKRLAFVHGDDSRLLHDLAQAEAFDFLFHGHTHVARDVLHGNTRIINPGALFRARPKSFLILELPAGVAQTILVE